MGQSNVDGGDVEFVGDLLILLRAEIQVGFACHKGSSTMLIFDYFHFVEDQVPPAEGLDCGLLDGPSGCDELDLDSADAEGVVVGEFLLVEDLGEKPPGVGFAQNALDPAVLHQVHSNPQNFHN